MKHIRMVFLTLVSVAMIAAGAGVFAAQNLISNPSFEQQDASGQPLGWNKSKTGTNNAAFNYPVAGYSGNGANIAITQYSSGRAEWYFNEIPVSSGQKYTYTETYKTGAATQVRVRYTSLIGTYQYGTLGSPTAAADWTKLTYNFTVPSTAKSITIMHGLKSIGNLTIDETSLFLRDTQKPTVSITNPTSNQSVTGVIKFVATASDNEGVAGVQFVLDGVNFGSEDTQAPYEIEWDSSKAKVGTHRIKAIARDTSDNKTSSVVVYFKVVALKPDTTAPLVQITSPAAGATLSGSVDIEASASDPVVSGATTSGVKQVDFLVDGALVGTASGAAPYRITYNTAALNDGLHTIGARATDVAGNIGIASQILITTNNGNIIPPGGINLVPNPSLENPDPGNQNKPANWNFDSWSGYTITAVSTYPVAGRNGGVAAKTEITAYNTDGDAKWYFDPVQVTPGTTYKISDYYKSNIPSRVVVWFITTAGADEYIEVGPLDPAADWTPFAGFITAPQGAAKMSVFHIIEGVGWLITDDYSLAVFQPSTNLILNPDLESSAGGLPVAWSKSGWGTNSRVFSYGQGLGRNGTRGAKVEMSSCTDGDARWQPNEVAVDAGAYYKFSDWYKSNINTKIFAYFTFNDGTYRYVDLRSASPAADWTLYSDQIQAPINAKTASIYHAIAGNGWLMTDDYSLEKTSLTGFDQPIVTLTFDDGWEDNVGNVLPLLASNDFKATYYFATQYLEGVAAGVAAVQTIAGAGHEIGSHSVTHPFLTQATAEQLAYELSHSKSYLEGLVGAGNVKSFATPYGDYNQTVLNAIKTYYQSHRTVEAGYNMPEGFDKYRIKVQNMLSTTTLGEYQSWLDQAKQNNFWLVLLYHRVDESKIGPYDTYLADFQVQMNALKNSGIAVKPITQALAQVAP